MEPIELAQCCMIMHSELYNDLPRFTRHSMELQAREGSFFHVTAPSVAAFEVAP